MAHVIYSGPKHIFVNGKQIGRVLDGKDLYESYKAKQRENRTMIALAVR